MVRGFAVVYLGANHILLEYVRISCERIFDGEAQEAPEPVRLRKEITLQNDSELRAYLLFRDVFSFEHVVYGHLLIAEDEACLFGAEKSSIGAIINGPCITS